jgi:protein ImuA
MPHDLLPALRERVRRIEQPTAAMHGVLPFRVAAIDRALPGGGLARGVLHEILGANGDEEDGALAAAFAAGIVARLIPAADGIGLWCTAQPDLYGPGLAGHGLDPARLVVARAVRDAEILWAMEEGLRTPGVTVVVGEVGILPDVAGRRLQLAAERSGITAFVLRRWLNGEQAGRERDLPSSAATRWRITALPSQPIPIRPFIREFAPSTPFAIRHPVRFQPGACPQAEPGATPRDQTRGDSSHGESGDPGAAGTVFLTLGPRFRGGDGYEVRVRNRNAHRGEPGIGYPRWRVELLRCRGGAPACWVVEVREGQVRDATDTLSLAAALAYRAQTPIGGDVRPPQRFRRTG